ncbi:MAG: DUF4125 family protein [Oscillospiraceae bacterium]
MSYIETIREIIAQEWAMFQSTQNAGGRAPCQDDHATFYAMRFGQFAAWSEEARVSYLADLTCAGEEGRNLVAEKYLRMMEFTCPEAYAAQRSLLPPLTREQRALADRLCDEMICQTVRLRQAFPLIGGAGRPLYSREDTPCGTSVETYERGELYTYSLKTLQALQRQLEHLEEQGLTLPGEILRNTVKSYGYDSLEAAEEWFSQRTADGKEEQ